MAAEIGDVRVRIEAGVRTTAVRYSATIHDFMMLNPLRSSAASR